MDLEDKSMPITNRNLNFANGIFDKYRFRRMAMFEDPFVFIRQSVGSHTVVVHRFYRQIFNRWFFNLFKSFKLFDHTYIAKLIQKQISQKLKFLNLNQVFTTGESSLEISKLLKMVRHRTVQRFETSRTPGVQPLLFKKETFSYLEPLRASSQPESEVENEKLTPLSKSERGQKGASLNANNLITTIIEISNIISQFVNEVKKIRNISSKSYESDKDQTLQKTPSKTDTILQLTSKEPAARSITRIDYWQKPVRLLKQNGSSGPAKDNQTSEKSLVSIEKLVNLFNPAITTSLSHSFFKKFFDNLTVIKGELIQVVTNSLISPLSNNLNSKINKNNSILQKLYLQKKTENTTGLKIHHSYASIARSGSLRTIDFPRINLLKPGQVKTSIESGQLKTEFSVNPIQGKTRFEEIKSISPHSPILVTKSKQPGRIISKIEKNLHQLPLAQKQDQPLSIKSVNYVSQVSYRDLAEDREIQFLHNPVQKKSHQTWTWNQYKQPSEPETTPPGNLATALSFQKHFMLKLKPQTSIFQRTNHWLSTNTVLKNKQQPLAKRSKTSQPPWSDRFSYASLLKQAAEQSSTPITQSVHLQPGTNLDFPGQKFPILTRKVNIPITRSEHQTKEFVFQRSNQHKTKTTNLQETETVTQETSKNVIREETVNETIKKITNREIHSIANQVFSLLEKRISIEKDRRGIR